MAELKTYTLTEVCEILKVTKRTVYNYIKAEQLKAVKFGREWRVSEKELESFLNRGTTKDYKG